MFLSFSLDAVVDQSRLSGFGECTADSTGELPHLLVLVAPGAFQENQLMGDVSQRDRKGCPPASALLEKLGSQQLSKTRGRPQLVPGLRKNNKV